MSGIQEHLRMDGVTAGAVIIPPHRYALWRRWDASRLCMAVTMLNPSRANHLNDDPTVKQLVKIARHLGFGSLYIVNLHAYQTPSPDELFKLAADPIGPQNPRYLRRSLMTYDYQIAAWGAQGDKLCQATAFLKLAERYRRTIRVLALTASGHPHHPLRMKTSYDHLIWKDYP